MKGYRAWLMALSVILAGCGPASIVNETTEIKSGEWAYDDGRRISVEINDTLRPLNYYLLIRHGANYPYQNLIVYFKTYYPNHSYKIDTIDCPLADKEGRWYGKGLGDLLDNKVMFRRNVQLPHSGDYSFEIQHAMRPDTIYEIYDIGLLIEPSIR